MHTKLSLLAALLLTPTAALGQVAYWNFNNLSAATNGQTSYGPDFGSGSLTLTGGWAAANITNFGGSTINVRSGDPAGQALALQGGTGNSNNGKQLVIQVSLTGLQDPILTYATQKTSTGFNSIQAAYSTDGVNYTNFGTPHDPATAFALRTLDFSTVNALDGVATVYLRLTFSGATSATGNNRLDNIQINASPGGGGTSTSPTATGAATSVAVGAATTFSGTITPGTNPASTALAATCNLTAVGGSASFALTVTGNALSGSYTVPGLTAANTYVLPCTVSDGEARSGSFSISLTVTAPFSCGAPRTLISSVQGSGAASPVVGSIVEIEGNVTGVYQGTARLGGFYLQDEGDGNPATSDGIFVDEAAGGSQGAVTAGQRVRLRGTVAETFNQTVLNNVTAQLVCPTGNGLPAPVDVTFPVAQSTVLEQFEGMLVRFPQQLRVTDNFNLGRFGEVGLAVVPNYGTSINFTRLMSGTQVAAPGAAALAANDLNGRSRIVLDDGSNNTYANLAPSATWPLDGGGLTFSNTLRIGDRVNVDAGGTYTPVVGVLGFGFSAYRLQPIPSQPITFGPSDNPRPASPPITGGRVKVMSANVLNYFTTYTSVSANARGADNAAEFQRQRDKIIAVFKAANPAVIAISELENDAATAIADLVDDAVNAFGNSLNTGNPGKWAYINTGVVGTDAIRVAFIYQPALVQPVGVHKVLDSTIDPRALTTRNRPALAQTFKLLAGGKPSLQHFTVVANHFKSKGSACTSAPADPDLNDGQDDCNLSRVSMAQALIDWLATNPTSDPTPVTDRRFLIVGDLNAHLKEDPLTAMTNPGFTKPASAVFPAGIAGNPNATYKDLVGTIGDPAGYSYLFSAQSGALDHALANPPLFRLITGAVEWHINADEPVVFDYNSDYDGNSSHTNNKSAAQLAAYYNAGAFRASDHDPLLVGFNPLCGDLNDDGVVDTADLTLMRAAVGQPAASVDRRMDFDGSGGSITLTDYQAWSRCYTQYRNAAP